MYRNKPHIESTGVDCDMSIDMKVDMRLVHGIWIHIYKYHICGTWIQTTCGINADIIGKVVLGRDFIKILLLYS